MGEGSQPGVVEGVVRPVDFLVSQGVVVVETPQDRLGDKQLTDFDEKLLAVDVDGTVCVAFGELAASPCKCD
jgi:hypothetical protein